MRVVLVEPGKKPEIREIENTYEALRDTVNGFIEFVKPFGNRSRVSLVCNDEAKLIGLEPNRYIFDGLDVVCGTFLVVYDGDDGDLTDLPLEVAEKMVKYFNKIPVFTEYPEPKVEVYFF